MRAITVADLPDVRGRELPDGGYLEPIRPFLQLPRVWRGVLGYTGRLLAPAEVAQVHLLRAEPGARDAARNLEALEG